MSPWISLIIVAAFWLAAAMTPGPNFLLTVRMALTQSRRTTLAAIAGVGVGTLGWGLAALLGLRALFVAAPWFYEAIKLLGGAYLAWLGTRLLWRGAVATEEDEAASGSSKTTGQAFLSGVATNLANPKTTVFVASLFAAALPRTAPLAEGLVSVALMVAISLGWYSLVMCLFTRPVVRRVYSAARCWVDRATGLGFIGLGAGLVFDQHWK